MIRFLLAVAVAAFVVASVMNGTLDAGKIAASVSSTASTVWGQVSSASRPYVTRFCSIPFVHAACGTNAFGS